MDGSVLYGNSTAIPNTRGHFHRPRLDRMFSDLLDRHLIVVTAGAGCGKTYALSDFLRNAPVRALWFQLSELDNNPSRFWEGFVYILEFQYKDTASQLKQLGFPDTLAKFDAFLHFMAKDIYAREQVVLVFDDFHLINNIGVLRFVQHLINAKLENFCIIINSRTNVSFNISSMLINELASRITAKDLNFTLDEIKEYLKEQGILLSAREIKKVHEFTEGWPLATYLVGLSIKNGGKISDDSVSGVIPLVFEMIENEVFSLCTPHLQNFLIKVSLLNSFPEGIVRLLAGEHIGTVFDFINNNMFVFSNPYTGSYNFHYLFLEFLKAKQGSLSDSERNETYLKAARWCADNDQIVESLSYYDKCGARDEVLRIILSLSFDTFTKSAADFYIGLIDQFPEDIIRDNPLLRVHRAGLLYNNGEPSAAIDELLATRDILLPPTDENKAVLGELYFRLGLINLRMANRDFVEQFKKASEYLPNGLTANRTWSVINTKYAIMMSSTEPGELDKMVGALCDAMPYAQKAGYGHGLEHLAAAEAAYFTGDANKAAMNAYKALYSAKENQVHDISVSAYFMLMRIEALNGNYEGVNSNLEQMKAYVEDLGHEWSFNGMLDIAEGWFHLLNGNSESVARWLIDDTMGSNALAPYSTGNERTVKAKYLLNKGSYYELLAWLEQSEKPIRQFGMWLILLELLICKSIALHQINAEQQAIDVLNEAYEISRGNKLVMQFVEFGNDIRTIIYSAKNSESNMIPHAWLDDIFSRASVYEKQLRSIKLKHNRTSMGQTPEPLFKITKREKEMLVYLCQGMTNAEIAGACFVTVSAVKKTLNSLYIKLNATNRADAVKTAIQNGLYITQ